MADGNANAGERAERARARRFAGATAAMFAGGLVLGLATAVAEGGKPWTSGGTVPPALAGALAVLMLVGVGLGAWRYRTAVDELWRARAREAGAAGATMLLGGYPLWWILWKGGLAPEPMHVVLYGAVLLTAVVTYAWRLRA